MNDKRKALLDSALELFSSRGYEHTPTSLISKNAGVATGTLFHYFSSKEGLIGQLLIECKAGMLRSVLEHLSEKTEAEEMLRAIWEGIVCWGLENEERYLFIMQHKKAGFIKDETRVQMEEQLAGENSELFARVGTILNKDFLRDIPMEMMGELVMSLIEGTISYFRKNRMKYEDSAYREKAYQMFFRSVTK